MSLLASVVAIPIGWMADRYDHRLVMLLCLLTWASATLLGATTGNFYVLFACTVGMGLGDSGFAPLVYSLIPRIFTEDRRFFANSVYAVTNLLGLGLGLALATGVGVLGEGLIKAPQWSSLTNWQAALVVAAAFAVPLAVAVAGMKVGRKGALAQHSGSTPRLELKRYLRLHSRTAITVFCGLGLGNLGISAISVWLPLLLGREYGVEAETAGNSMAVVYFIGVGLGVFVATFGMRVLKRKWGVAMPARVIGGGCSIAVVLSVGLWLAQSPMQVYVLFGAMVVCVVSASVLAPNMMQEMTPVSVRSSVIAAGLMLSGILAALCGPLVGVISDAVNTNAHGLRLAVVLVALTAFLLAAGLFFWIEAAYVRTVESVAS
jgi:MFS family permease